MAKRVGKYKISKRESALNLIDGGQLEGDLTVKAGTTLDLKGGATIIHQDFAVASGSATGDNAFTGDAGVLTEAAHAGKIVYLPDFNANATLRIPTPSKAGVTYRLISNNVADDAHNVVISFPDDACYFQGAVVSIDENDDDASSTSTIYANGSTHDVLTITAGHYIDLTLTSLSTTKMLVSGLTVSDDHAAFSNAD